MSPGGVEISDPLQCATPSPFACMTFRDTLLTMTRAISVRLDADALGALTKLEATGLSRSEAIRRALVDAAERMREKKVLAAEVALLEADDEDRSEMLEVADLMEQLRAPR